MTAIRSAANVAVEVQSLKGVNSGALEAIALLTNNKEFSEHADNILIKQNRFDIPAAEVSPTYVAASKPSKGVGLDV